MTENSKDTLLMAENLSFRYRDREEYAIEAISLEMSSHELLLVAGPSGCGKTTFVRCINGLSPRSYKGELSGRILLQGQDIEGLALAKISRRVGTVLQDPERQILGTKVVNEVAFGLENLGMEREEIFTRVEETMDYLGITQLRDRDTFSLSGGEKQKVALAGVLAMRPGLLLLDEPLASLDPASSEEALGLLRRLVDEGLGVIIVEHRVEDVLKISPDKVMLMDNGNVVYSGPASGLERVVDPREVKLPAKMVMRLVSAEKRSIARPIAHKTPQTAPDELVRFDHVSFEYERNVEVLHDITLTIRRGDVIAVLGPNGAGKTTLIKHAIGLLKPSSGSVVVEESDTRELTVAEVANSLGYVFQSPSHMLFAPTVAEELAFGPVNLGHRPEEIEKEVEEAARIVNLTGLENDPPLSLSFGQQKRVTIAAILAMSSKILVMDEPTAGQDYKNYTDFMDSILGLPNFEAILFITHDIDLAIVYANRVILVDGGKILADGDPHDVMKDFDLLRQSRLVPTSLLEVNLDLFEHSGRFLRAEELAYYEHAVE